jgi:YfiH family protein
VAIEWQSPDWPVASLVRAAVVARSGGVSAAGYAQLNLASHVGDDPQLVARNRQLLVEELALPGEPVWLDQVHGRRVVQLPFAAGEGLQADGAYTLEPAVVCAVLTADCLPLLISSRCGGAVAALHAGWRGLVGGVIEEGIGQLVRHGFMPGSLCVWLGPAIGADHFEVGDEVREQFLADDPASVSAFVANRPGHWLADIYQLARSRLDRLGVGWVGGGGECTYCDSQRYFSYRRQQQCGRFASLIWR